MGMVEKIREEMENKGIKQKDLVEFLGATQSNVAKWLSLNEKIRLDIPNTILAKIAHYLDVDIEYLLGLQDEKRKVPQSLIHLDADFSKGLEELIKDYMELDETEQELYKAEIKAKALRKRLNDES